MKKVLDQYGREITINTDTSVILHATYTLAKISGIKCWETGKAIGWGHKFILDDKKRTFCGSSETFQRNHKAIRVDENSEKNLREEIASGLYDTN